MLSPTRPLQTRSSFILMLSFSCVFFQFAMCFVFTNCPVVYFVAVRSTHRFMLSPFWLLVGVRGLAGVFVVLFLVVFCSFESELTYKFYLLCYFL